jgi:DNA polymerase-1
MAKADNKLEYEHYFKPCGLDYSFSSNFKFKLVESTEELRELLKDAKGKRIAYDSETDGLDYNRHEIVGFSFSFDRFSGYYVPLRHESYAIREVKVPKIDSEGNPIMSKKNVPLLRKEKVKDFTIYENNLDVKQSLDIMYEALTSAKLVLAHNSIFDMMMLKKEGYDTSKINTFDTMCLTYNADTNATGMFGLKPASEHFLGRRAIKFKEVLGKEKTFKYVSPVDCCEYACADTANTYGLFDIIYPILEKEGCNDILTIDNNLVKSFRDYYTEAPIYIDKVVMGQYRDEIIARKEFLEKSIYNHVGYPFNIRSKSKELVAALGSLGIHTGVETATGIMSVSKEALTSVIGEHPVVKELIELSSLEKQLNSYIDKLANCESTPENDSVGICRVNYKLFGTSSGRLACGNSVKSKGDENDYFINLNIQNLTKPKDAMYEAIKLNDISEGILGWDFILRDKEYIQKNPDKYYVEGQSPEINVRKAIRTKDDSELIVHLDYNAEEVRLAGVLSGERNFIEPFQNDRDVHTEMAIKLFGQKEYSSSKRKAAKIATFGLLYGGNSYVLQGAAKSQGLDLSEEEAKDLYTRWWRANKTLKVWQNMELQKAKSNSFVVPDLFGRPRRLKHYLLSEDKGLYNFGVRSIASHKVQGGASSIMRVLMNKLANSIFKHPKYSQEVSFVSVVHDEVNFRIKKQRIVKWIKTIEDMMTYQPPNFEIPLTCGIDVGTSLGYMFTFIWKDSTKTELVPERKN